MKWFRLLLVLAVLAAAALLFVLYAPFGPATETFVEIAPHTGTTGIGAELAREGVVRSGWVFAALRELRGGSLKAGEYRFDHPVSMTEVYDRIVRGDVYTVALVIPEGYNIFDIAQAVQSAGLGDAAAFLAAEQSNTQLIASLAPHASSLEGFLFPDTYRFSRRARPVDMLTTMVRRFHQIALRIGLHGTEVEPVVTMASLVEREVHVDSERARVAGVFDNRLKIGMPLQTDPAVVYASMLRGTWRGVIHQSELHSDSPYNTYAHKGLPPGPICNPGLAALKAALHPETTDFLFFVANPDGSTRFARSLQEHNANVMVYRRELDGAPGAGAAPGVAGHPSSAPLSPPSR